VVTPWWFQHIVEPMLRRLAPIVQVHVIAPTQWQNTGIGIEELNRCLDLTTITWSIIDPEDPLAVRKGTAAQSDLLELVRDIDADVTLCRSADFHLTAQFPGTVRYLMEAASGPFELDPSSITITSQPFAAGVTPFLEQNEQLRLKELIAPLWNDMKARRLWELPTRHELLRSLDLSLAAPTLLVPLEYEHEENFFLIQRAVEGSTRQLLVRLARLVDRACSIAVTDHPLNVLHLDRDELHRCCKRLKGRLSIAPGTLLGHSATIALASTADAIIVGDSKSFGLAAAFGKPLLRLSRFATADWLNAYSDPACFLAAIRTGDLRSPCQVGAQLWFAHHFCNETLLPGDPDLTGEDLIDRVFHPVNDNRWERAISHIAPMRRKA
jgi:hypothetical protein